MLGISNGLELAGVFLLRFIDGKEIGFLLGVSNGLKLGVLLGFPD